MSNHKTTRRETNSPNARNPFDIFRRLASALFLLSCAALTISAEPLEAKIEIVSTNPARVRVEGRREGGATAWSFRKSYASVIGLEKRIENLSLADGQGAQVAARQLAPGEFEAERPATRFSYVLKLDPPDFVTDSPHVSWLAGEYGLLMLGDVLPLSTPEAQVSLILPAGWSVSSSEERDAAGRFIIADAERAVFAVGRGLRERRGRAGGMEFLFASAGEWAFADEEATEVLGELLKEHEKVLGGAPRRRVSVALMPLPRPGGANVWAAETRGATVTLVSGRLPSKLAALAQLGGALTHEALHLWVPNALALEGEYDWFYEGFTNYQALRVGMRREQLRFQDYLNALGRAYDSYKSARGPRELSLTEASRRRWSGSPALVYHKGMLVAFLYDLTLMHGTGGKSSLDDVYRELFRRFGGGQSREDANAAVAGLLGRMAGMREFTERFVQSATPINLAEAVAPFGLVVEPGGARTHVGVAASLDRPQRELLRKLGYNEKLEAESRELRQRMRRRQE
ncbi:MAG TPA: hypothetical protein VG148_01935 [Pyrinomonadaceae bacterium]|nr:hypothetical protein [Pyrinomonadaceae bacterium]